MYNRYNENVERRPVEQSRRWSSFRVSTFWPLFTLLTEWSGSILSIDWPPLGCRCSDLLECVYWVFISQLVVRVTCLQYGYLPLFRPNSKGESCRPTGHLSVVDFLTYSNLSILGAHLSINRPSDLLAICRHCAYPTLFRPNAQGAIYRPVDHHNVIDMRTYSNLSTDCPSPNQSSEWPVCNM